MTDEVSVRVRNLADWMTPYCQTADRDDTAAYIQDWVSKMRTDDPVAGVLASAGLIADLDVQDVDIYIGIVERMIGIWKAKSETAPTMTLSTVRYPFVPDDDPVVTPDDVVSMFGTIMCKLDDIAAQLDGKR